MPILTSSPAARIALAYITTGALIETWSVIWYMWLNRHPPERDAVMFFCYGLMATGVILLAIGMSLGWIGRAARHAELPPPEATAAVAQAEVNQAANTPAVMMPPVQPAMMPAGQALPPPAAVPVTPGVAPVASLAPPGKQYPPAR